MTAPPLQKALGIKSQDKIEESYGAFSRAWERKAWRIAPERIIGKEKKKVMKELYELMKKARPGAAFDMETDLIAGRILDSLAMIRLVVAIEKEFDVKITPKDMTPDNFKSVASIYALIEKLDEE